MDGWMDGVQLFVRNFSLLGWVVVKWGREERRIRSGVGIEGRKGGRNGMCYYRFIRRCFFVVVGGEGEMGGRREMKR